MENKILSAIEAREITNKHSQKSQIMTQIKEMVEKGNDHISLHNLSLTDQTELAKLGYNVQKTSGRLLFVISL